MKKIMASIILVISLCVCTVLTGSAAMMSTSLETAPDQNQITTVITEYFSARNQIANAREPAVTSMSPAVQNDAVERTVAMKTFWNEHGVYIISSENTVEILSTEAGEAVGTIEVEAYEWTRLYYNETGINNAATDDMGFGTEHKILLQMNSNGEYVVVKDGYEEELVHRYTSPFYIQTETEITEATPVEIGNLASNITPYALNATNGSGMPNLSACLSYANAYGGTRRNNAVYADLSDSGGDCANFVSQCLAAGGFENDPGSTSAQIYDSATQWWHRKDGSAYSSKAWRGALSIQTYWGARYQIVNMAANMSNVYPGNPIFTNSGGHVAICVGYTSSGTPLYSGHTSDADRLVLTYGTGSNDFGKTMLIQSGYCSGNHISGTMVYNSLGHWRQCTNCRSGATAVQSHSFTYDGSVYSCTVCAYKTSTPPPILPLNAEIALTH